jgi:hypothetical protein
MAQCLVRGGELEPERIALVPVVLDAKCDGRDLGEPSGGEFLPLVVDDLGGVGSLAGEEFLEVVVLFAPAFKPAVAFLELPVAFCELVVALRESRAECMAASWRDLGKSSGGLASSGEVDLELCHLFLGIGEVVLERVDPDAEVAAALLSCMVSSARPAADRCCGSVW